MHVVIGLLFTGDPENHDRRALFVRGSEEAELLPGRPEDLVLLNLKDVEANRLRQRAALANRQNVTLLRLEARGAMHRDVVVALVEPLVLLNEVEVIPADDDGAVHLARRDAHTLEDAAANVDLAREGALLVNVLPLLGFLRDLEAEADALMVAVKLAVLPDVLLRANEDVVLLLVRALVLIHGEKALLTT